VDGHPGRSAAAFRSRDFRFYQAARLCAVLGLEAQSVAVGWQIYDITHRALDLGLVGLAQFLPFLGFSLVTGQTADRFDRRLILMVCYALEVVASTLLFALAHGTPSPWLIYGVLLLVGTAHAFSAPTGQAFMPDLVPEEDFPNAVAWSSSVFQLATIMGPGLGGAVYWIFHRSHEVYGTAAILLGVAFVMTSRIRARTGRMEKRAVSWGTLVAGIRYVFRQKIVLGSISLDLFAVLLGGAVALLPIYAKDILHVGPAGLGLLRSAPALGAAITAVWLAVRPPARNTGALMLICVFLFGAGTIGFGLSTSVGLSLAFLVLVGAADMVSVWVRGTLVQLATPPEMRGRVSAVNMLFIGTTNEFGEFESGFTAQWFGAKLAVVLGGIGTCVVVAAWTLLFPSLRQVDRLSDVKHEPIRLEGDLQVRGD
jgi:MFS family permease